MERITEDDSDDDVYEEQVEEQDFENQEKLREYFTKEELVELCSGFARENMKLIRWLYKNHLNILRSYENKYCGGKHIHFGG